MTRSARLAWLLCGCTIVLFAAALVLGVRNGSLSADPAFAVLVIAMMVGYVSVGAFVASRVPSNPIGWLLMVTGIGLMVEIASSEYAVYGLYTDPGALPFTSFAAWLNQWTFLVAIGAILLLIALFPNGSAASRRWRWLPPVIVVDIALAIVTTILTVGQIDLSDVHPDPPNPTGVEALGSIVGPVLLIAGFGALALAILAVVSLALRYRASEGEERQQIRWLAYVGLLSIGLFLLTIASGIGLEQGESTPLNDALFIAFFISIGIGIPAAAAIAVMRYRLWDLDVILKKTIVATILVILLTIASWS
jgi:hypothetical protein